MKEIEERAVALLAMRDHGDLELKRKLKQKFLEASELDIEQVLLACQAKGWQRDDRFIEAYVRQAIAKGQGPYKIRHALQEKSSHQLEIEAHLALDDEDWVAIACEALSKKYGDCRSLTDRKEQAKRMRFLQSRGFSQNQIWQAVKE